MQLQIDGRLLLGYKCGNEKILCHEHDHPISIAYEIPKKKSKLGRYYAEFFFLVLVLSLCFGITVDPSSQSRMDRSMCVCVRVRVVLHVGIK